MPATHKASKPDSRGKQRLRLWLRLLAASRAIESDLRERLRSQCDTTLPRFDVLAALYRSPRGLRMNELSKQLKVSNGNITGIVDRLSHDGLVVRGSIEGDRRAWLIRLTPRGTRQFELMAAEHETWVREILSVYDDTEVEELITLLDKFANEEPSP